MQFQNYDYTQSFKAKQDKYDGMVVYDKQYGVENEKDERYEAGMSLGACETAPIRIVSLGKAGVGLSSFILKCVYNEFNVEPWDNNLLQWDHHQFEYQYENEKLRISFSDLKGFDSSISKEEMNDSIYKALEYSNVILLFYSMDNNASFEGDYSIQDIKTHVDTNLAILKKRKIVLLIATKLDLENDNENGRQVATETGENIANMCGEIPFFEVSNKTGENIKQVMDQICDIFKYDSDSANYPHIQNDNENHNENDNENENENEENEQKEEEIHNNNMNNNIEMREATDSESDIDETTFFIGDKLTFSPHCCCCGWIEHCLLNYSFCGTCCGCIFYIPFMFFLYLLWLLQIPITLIINLFAFMLCCNFCKCECCRGSLFIADDESVPDAHYGVMLHTAESIRHLHLQNNSNQNENNIHHNINDNLSDNLIPNSPSKSDMDAVEMDNNKNNNLQSISILQWNIFGQLGRYWKRYPLLTTTISDLSPDILCLQEAVTSKWWRFGTINTMKKINNKYRGFHVSAYNVLHDYNKLFFQYSFCWRTINEFQSCCNLYCLVPFWKQNFWKYSLHSNVCCNVLFNTFNGIIAQIGNAIVFKNNYQLFRSYIPLQPGNRRMALRSLFILKDNKNTNDINHNNNNSKNSYGQRLSITMKKDKKNNKIKKKQRKKIWIVCTHLSPHQNEHENENDNGSMDENESTATKQIKQIIEWMENAQNKICKADAIIICGDFNCTPNSNIYNIMQQNGYESVVKSKKGKEQWTYPTDTWKYQRYTDDMNDSDKSYDNNEKITKDYIWIKSKCKIKINKIRLIGREYKDSTHKGEPIKIYPSDHLGIYVTLSI